ncbi:MAG: ABC transporter permease [Firmicutes bacterium]|nr:ABC transporter permease [Bacillota bacterium]MBQ6294800.1 ABC transporter permease [Bacillota bacterium]MBR0051854.1 ABC transporter permease [Bacillota bacterium]MBR0209188.1 ABC transporter permease [Bacillota bacterium]MBR0516706.1 ABC transporter permease [Bacillota bacterium]
MRDYVIKRISQGILLVIVVSILVFAMLDLMPGDPINIMTDRKVSAEVKEQLRIEYHLNLPLHQRYVIWVKDMLHGNFGKSIKTKLPVTDMMKARLPVTLKLTLTSLLVELIIAVPIGLLAAYKKDSIFDRIVMDVSLFFTAVPSYWIAVIFMLLFAVRLRILPLSGFSTPLHYVLPVASLVVSGIASTIRMTKTEVLDVLREKYVLTAYAKGLKKKSVLVKHVLRNALILVTIMFFMSVPWVISGAVIIENIFTIPGMGQMLTTGILNQDFPIVQACVFILAILTVVCNLICDIITAVLDPRIRISLGGEN